MTTQKKIGGFSQPSQKTTGLNVDILSTSKKLLSFPIKVSNNNNNNKKKTKTPHCNCWVCKILDLSSSSVTNDKTKTTTRGYEAYNIVSERGDSIFYDPLLLSHLDGEVIDGQIYIAEDRILEFVQQDKLLAKHFNGADFNKYE